jgi:hypothetical protein
VYDVYRELKGKLESTKSEYDFILMRKEREGRQKVEALQEQVTPTHAL